MKKYINSKVYDTETAECVGEWDNGRYGRDFSACEERLYRKRTGEYFLYGSGGPMSKYSVSHGDNEWSGGEKIIPLSYNSAQKWAEEHLDGDSYEAIFGAICEDESHTTVTYSISAFAAEKAKRDSQQLGMSVSAYIEKLITDKK